MWPGREKPFEKYLPCWNVVIVSAHMRVMANSLGVKFRGVRVSPWQGGIRWVVAVYYSSVISVSLTIHTHGLNVVIHVENIKKWCQPGLLPPCVLVFYSLLSLLSTMLSTTKPHEQEVGKRVGKGCRSTISAVVFNIVKTSQELRMLSRSLSMR